MELWKQLLEAPEYEISNFGNVRYIPTGKIRKYNADDKGYCKYRLGGVDGKRISIHPHKSVAQYFLPPPAQYILDWAAGTKYKVPYINHIDGNKLNNHADNLEWCTASENLKHGRDNGLIPLPKVIGSRNGNTKLTEEQVIEIRSVYIPYDKQYGATPLALKYGVDKSLISGIASSKYRIHVKESNDES